MTLTDFRSLIGQIRYHYSSLTEIMINRKRLSSSYNIGIVESQLTIIGLYIDTLEDYFLPVKVVGTSSSGGVSIPLQKSIDSSDYERYIGHTIVGDGISDTVIVTRFDSDNIYLNSSTDSANSNVVYTIGENCLSIKKVAAIIHDINRILGTNLCFEGYWTEFDLDTIESVSENGLLYGSSASILTGSNIYASLSIDTAFAGTDTDILFSFNLEHPYFAYPAIFSDLQRILDHEGDDVLLSGAFNRYLLNVSVPGVVDPVQYKVYRTNYLTTINNRIYQFKF